MSTRLAATRGCCEAQRLGAGAPVTAGVTGGGQVAEPFWEASYRDSEAPGVFGEPAQEIVDLAPCLAGGARVLDLGCGDGRNALFLLQRGLQVCAIDISPAAVEKLRLRAGSEAQGLLAEVADLRSYSVAGQYDLVVAHGVLHLLPPAARERMIEQMQDHTSPGGYNVVAVFTDSLPPPEDLRPFMLGLFREGELFARYARWEAVLRRAYVLEDEHPGGIRHRHPVNKLVARRPA
jgi:tellurite methyltransferase